MDIHLIQSQIAINREAICEAEIYRDNFKELMKFHVLQEEYSEAKYAQTRYRTYKKRLASLVALQVALKRDKREKDAMFRKMTLIGKIAKTLMEN